MRVKASAYIVDHLDVVLEIIKGRSHVGSHCSLLGVGYRKNGEQDVSTGAKHALGVSGVANEKECAEGKSFQDLK